MQEDTAVLIADLKARQEALDARRCELDVRITEAAQEKDHMHHNARDLQRQVDSVYHDLVFARDAEQRLNDMKRLSCELQQQRELLHHNLLHSKDQLQNAVREREANVNFFAHAGQRLHRDVC